MMSLMSIDEIAVTIAGLAAILFVYWFFLGKKEVVVEDHSKHLHH